MRGEQIFKEIIKEAGLFGARRKGRNNSLISKRNECLVARYCFYGYFKNKCYEDTIRLLVSEFFLSPGTINKIIQDNSEQVLSVKQKSPTLYFFQNRWPHLKW